MRYSINWMGPINRDWIQKNGNYWAGGRIDVYGTDSDYPEEIGLPIMYQEDWVRLSVWLDELRTKELLTFEELVAKYEENNPRIRWWNHEKV